MYLIKFYKNRKHYDVQTSKYVNLKEIEFLFKTIDDINVVDFEGKDITGKTMLAVIANKKENVEDIFALSRIIKVGNGLLSNTNVNLDNMHNSML